MPENLDIAGLWVIMTVLCGINDKHEYTVKTLKKYP